MPCGDYVFEGTGPDGQDRVKGHLNGCPGCPRDPKSPSGDDTDRGSSGTPEPSARARGDLDDCTRRRRDPKSPSVDDTDRSSAGTPEPSARAGSDVAFTQTTIKINEITAPGAVIQNLVVSQTNIHMDSLRHGRPADR
ncbi:hypothetical protein LX36DRAFT_717008 [Colletotrichum falcatum]|nr:hypothetical protein LX36DRAFT_717008 [Colletotrichum falcatum]